MTLHIRGTVTGPVVLGPNSKHLTSIDSTGTVTSTGIGVDGIDGPAGNGWPIENDGAVISAGGFGISLASGGIVTNDSGAVISGGIAGILINGANGTVTNAGAITGIGGGTTINTTLISGDGIALLAGGSVSNAAGGSISAQGALGQADGSGAGVFITGGLGTVANTGSINATAYGVALDAGGSVTNTASIQGVEDGVKIAGASGNVANNSGSIVATRDDGVALFAGGAVKNAKGALIQSGSGTTNAAGVFITVGSGTVDNSGTIAGNTFGALIGFGSFNNYAGASITGATAGVDFNARPGTLVNSGSISASGPAGAELDQGGSITNAVGASISGSAFGVFVGGAADTVGTVVNAGTLSGGTDAVDFAGAGAYRLVVEQGAVFNGAVNGSTAAGATNTLELAAGAHAISGVGTGSFNNFQTLAVDAGSTATLNGPTVVPTVLDSGTIDIAGPLDANTHIRFLAPSELAIDNAGSFGIGVGTGSYAGPLLEGFTAVDKIDLKDLGFSPAVTLDPLTPSGVLQVTSGSQVADLAFQTSSLGTGTFQATSDHTGGTLISLA